MLMRFHGLPSMRASSRDYQATMSLRYVSLLVWALLLSCTILLQGTLRCAAAELEGFGDDLEEVIETVVYEPKPHITLSQPIVDAERGNNRPAAGLWDEDEFEGFASVADQESPPTPASTPVKKRSYRPAYVHQQHYYYEIAVVVFLVVYGVNVYLGKVRNEYLALSWARAFATQGAILEKNFSLLGPGDTEDGEILMKESQSVFKFYASGRRYCQSLLATLDLRSRHDLLSLAYYLVNPRQDEINIEVAMNEANMPQLVLAVGQPKLIRSMLKDLKDLSTYAKQTNVAKDRLPYWQGDKLQVATEHSSVFYDLFNDNRVEQVFEDKDTLKYFRFLHFTSEHEGTCKRVLKFSFALPPAEKMEDLGKLMAAVAIFIDIVGTYKLGPEAQKKATKIRTEIEEKAFKEGQQARQEAMQQKKVQKILSEKERLAKMTPEARQKFEEKQSKNQMKKVMKAKVMRI